ncbi:hypothetical protein ALP75_201737 [Pseudomonas syringae pv. actinidiae]|nr:hypothetical protein ALP75_201737 [Pseudomonas syringae pv. actinidiae]
MGYLRVDERLIGQLQANLVMMTLAGDRYDAPQQLVACTGAQGQAIEQVQVAAVFGRFQHLSLQGLHPLIETQHPFALDRQFGATATAPTDTAFYQRLLRQVVQLINGVPGCLVTQTRAFRRAGDRALFGNVLQQRNALRAADHVLRE